MVGKAEAAACSIFVVSGEGQSTLPALGGAVLSITDSSLDLLAEEFAGEQPSSLCSSP